MITSKSLGYFASEIAMHLKDGTSLSSDAIDP